MNIIEDFRRNKPAIIKYVKKNGLKDIVESGGGAVPLYAIWTFIGEEFPEYRDEVKKQKIERLENKKNRHLFDENKIRDELGFKD